MACEAQDIGFSEITLLFHTSASIFRKFVQEEEIERGAFDNTPAKIIDFCIGFVIKGKRYPAKVGTEPLAKCPKYVLICNDALKSFSICRGIVDKNPHHRMRQEGIHLLPDVPENIRGLIHIDKIHGGMGEKRKVLQLALPDLILFTFPGYVPACPLDNRRVLVLIECSCERPIRPYRSITTRSRWGETEHGRTRWVPGRQSPDRGEKTGPVFPCEVFCELMTPLILFGDPHCQKECTIRVRDCHIQPYPADKTGLGFQDRPTAVFLFFQRIYCVLSPLFNPYLSIDLREEGYRVLPLWDIGTDAIPGGLCCNRLTPMPGNNDVGEIPIPGPDMAQEFDTIPVRQHILGKDHITGIIP
ncbi:MAG: hypothetical protein A4E38_01419 [Methanoregulaceae archaeon PtaB.Bin108]|nr:MAG: hypothetical protein A4E38_01419 [Methanoregulaceae archaeon PtaB.Bin108]